MSRPMSGYDGMNSNQMKKIKRFQRSQITDFRPLFSGIVVN